MQPDYTTDVEYPTTYFHFQSPVLMSAAAMLTGHAHQAPASDFTYCEFGCGQALTMCLLAACNPDAKFFGVDINPDHIASAHRLAEQFDLRNVTLVNADFLELTPDDLPELDYAAITGVLSWLPDQARAGLLRYVSGQLKDGGLCFVHYLSMPGISRTLETTALTQLLSDRQDGDSSTRAVAAVSTLQSILRDNPHLAFNKASPETLAALNRQLKKHPKSLAHDILNRNPQPLWFHQLAQELSQHDIGFVSHARPHMNAFGELYIHNAAQTYIDFKEKHDDPVLREEMLGLLLYLAVRMDIFGKNVRKTDLGQISNFSGLRIFSLVGGAHEAARATLNPRVSTDLTQPVYTQILEAVAESDVAAADVFDDCSQKFGDAETRRALLHLFSVDLITFGRRPNAISRDDRELDLKECGKHIMTGFFNQSEQVPLPSKILTSCVKVSQKERALLAVHAAGDVKAVWEHMMCHGVKLRTTDKRVIDEYDTFAKIVEKSMPVFQAQRLPQLLQLGVLSS